MTKLTPEQADLRIREIYTILYEKIARTYDSSNTVLLIAELRDLGLHALNGGFSNAKVATNPRPVGISIRVRKPSKKRSKAPRGRNRK